MAIAIDKMANAIIDSLDVYSEELGKGVDNLAKKVATECKKQVASTSPKKTGSYSQGWAVKKQGNNYVVYNKTDYQLTHLLEKGHLNRDGSRTPAKVHIKPAEQKAIADFEAGLEVLIQNG